MEYSVVLKNHFWHENTQLSKSWVFFCEKQTLVHNLFTIKGAFVLTFEDRQSRRSLLQ